MESAAAAAVNPQFARIKRHGRETTEERKLQHGHHHHQARRSQGGVQAGQDRRGGGARVPGVRCHAGSRGCRRDRAEGGRQAGERGHRGRAHGGGRARPRGGDAYRGGLRPDGEVLHPLPRRAQPCPRREQPPHPNAQGHHVLQSRRFGHEARERQHRRRHRDGHHAQVRQRVGQAVLRDVRHRAEVRTRAPRGRHPHPRHGLLHAHHHVLPDRAAETLQGRLLHGPRRAARAERHRQLRCARLHRHPVQPERPARRAGHLRLRLRPGRRRAQDVPSPVQEASGRGA